jgi:lipoprotein-anchoring transpeptidase ErfK/SrfK
MSDVSRRRLLTGASAAAVVGLAGAASANPAFELAHPPVRQPPPGAPALWRRSAPPPPPQERLVEPRETIGPGGGVVDHSWAAMYGPVQGEPFPVRGIDVSRLEPQFLRQEVPYTGSHPAGSIVVDPRGRHLYHVMTGGRAMRYGVGVGRQGFAWSGEATINSKQQWPDWYPPAEMIERDPSIRAQLSQLRSGLGVAGGPRNPLGARALYLWQGNRDTLYRIHGTLEPYSIGRNVSSGCIRMINQDAIHLYDRVAVGSRVIVLS